MSYFIVDFEKEKKYDFDDIVIDEKITISEDSSKYLIFYDKDNAKELYLKIPRVRLTFDWTIMKYNNLKLRLTPKYSKINNFINYVYDLEDYIINYKNIKKKNLEFVSILEKEKNIYYLKTFFNENKIIISSDTGNKIKFSDFKNNGEIQLILKISGVWKKNNKYGLSTQIYQIKYYAPPEDHNLDMIDINENTKENKIKREEKHISDTDTQQKGPMNFPKQTFALNPELLQSVKLKKIDK